MTQVHADNNHILCCYFFLVDTLKQYLTEVHKIEKETENE